MFFITNSRTVLSSICGRVASNVPAADTTDIYLLLLLQFTPDYHTFLSPMWRLLVRTFLQIESENFHSSVANIRIIEMFPIAFLLFLFFSLLFIFTLNEKPDQARNLTLKCGIVEYYNSPFSVSQSSLVI